MLSQTILKEVQERTVKSFLDVITASILMRNESYGYDIIKEIHENFHVLLSPGSVYPMLYSMEKRGLVEYHEKDRKKSYTLTEPGIHWLNGVLEACKNTNLYNAIQSARGT